MSVTTIGKRLDYLAIHVTLLRASLAGAEHAEDGGLSREELDAGLEELASRIADDLWWMSKAIPPAVRKLPADEDA